jgi:hypothetical protein
LNVLSRLRNLQDLTTQTISIMPITFDIENDSIAKLAIDRKTRKDIERLLLLDKLSVSEISMVLDVPEDFVWEIKEAMELRNLKK